MPNNSFKKIIRQTISAVLAVAVLSGGIVPAQTRRGTTATRKPSSNSATTKKTAAAPEEKIDAAKLMPPNKGQAMSEPYRIGKLPAPAALPAGDVDEQARLLAEMVNAGDENSVAALMTAIVAAGYGLRDASGDVKYNADGNWQGIAFDDWLVAATAKLHGDGFGVGFRRFADTLKIVAPETTKTDVAETLVADIRKGLRHPNPSVKFWSHFVVELGRGNSENPYDLLQPMQLDRARLDAVQLAFVLTRLAGDALAVSRSAQQRAAIEEKNELEFEPSAMRRVGMSYRPESDTDGGRFERTRFKESENALAKASDNPPLPCNLNETESVILDYSATGITTLFGTFTGYIEPKSPGAEKYNKFAGVANIALKILKTIVTYVALDTEITMDAPVLVRTKTTQAGERRMLTAKLKNDVGKWQAINCIRPALNAAGLDFDIPGAGPLGNVRVKWRLEEGGDSRGYWGRVLNTALNVNEILAGQQIESDAIVFLDPAADATRPEDKKYYNFTDDNGESKIPVVGMPQKRDLSKEPVREVIKPMGVRLAIQVKTMRLKDKTAVAGTVGDVTGDAIAFLTADDALGKVEFGVGVASESLMRSTAGFSKTFYFPVKDWIPCDGRWRGTVTYQRIFDDAVTGGGKGVVTDDSFSIARTRREYWARLDVVQVPGQNPYGDFKATATIASIDEHLKISRAMYRDSCFYEKGLREKITENFFYNAVQGAGGGAADSFSTFILGEKANINFSLPDIPAKSTTIERTTKSGFCDANKPSSSNRESNANIQGIRFGQEVPVDPKNPNVLRGSRSVPGSKGQKMVFTWNLSRCQ